MFKNEKNCNEGCIFIGCSWINIKGVFFPEVIADQCTSSDGGKQHIITYKKDLKKWTCIYFNGFEDFIGAFSPKDKGIIVTSKPIAKDSLILKYESFPKSTGQKEDDLPTSLIQTPLKAKTIGSHLYLAGWDRAIVRRDGINQWTLISQETQTPELKGIKESYNKGFQDVDGFTETDMYAVGGRGDVWRFDGSHWHRLDMPVNIRTYAVCCGDDGNVYIGGNGFILKGREEDWEIIQQESMEGFRPHDMCWFKDTLYISSWENNRLYQFKDNTFSVFPFTEGDIPDAFHSLAVCDDYLLSAGGQCISIFNGKHWDNLYGGTTFTEKQALRKDLETIQTISQDLEKAEDILENIKDLKK